MMSDFEGPGPEAKVFVISVAAELSGLHPQTLRTYDRLGLVAPGRTGGGGRRYSLRDIELLRTVARLTAEGLGLEGVRRVIELENQVMALQEKVAELNAELAASRLPQNLPALIADSQVVIWRKMGR
jgi:MerR family transcriptional regulator/heat shock protein HspR